LAAFWGVVCAANVRFPPEEPEPLVRFGTKTIITQIESNSSFVRAADFGANSRKDLLAAFFGVQFFSSSHIDSGLPDGAVRTEKRCPKRQT
jgi:hypothetical protein